MAFLPVSSLVNVSVNLASAPAQAQSLSNILILGTSDVIDITSRARTYSTLSAVATDFGTTAPEYLAAVEWFGQSPTPGYCLIGQWAKTSLAGRLIGGVVSSANQAIAVWNAITNGGFHITVDAGTSTNITGINFSGATNLNGVASLINAALTSASIGAVVSWNSVYNQFSIKSNTTGTTSFVSFLTSPTGGGITDISTLLAGTSVAGAYSVQGVAAETAANAVVAFDNQFGQQWYAVFISGAADSDHLAVAAYIEGSNTKHAYGVNTQEAGVLTSTDTTNIAYQLKALGYHKTVVQYSSTTLYAVVSLLARILTTNYNANKTVITLAYKTEPGTIAESLTQTQANNASANYANVFENFDNNTAIIYPGITSSGDYIDTIFGADWLAITIQNTIWNLLYSNPTKIQQTDGGNNIISSAIAGVLDQTVANGLLAPGTWTQAGFGTLNQGDFLAKGYYVYAPLIATQNPSDRAARKSVTFQVAAKIAGAIQSVACIVNINR